MSQNYDGAFGTSPYAGSALMADLIAFVGDALSGYKGASRPSYIAAGGVWVKEVSSTQWDINLFDGTNDRIVASVNPVNGVISLDKRINFGAVGSIAPSSGVLTLGASGNSFTVTGTDPVTSIVVPAGCWFKLRFADALVLTHHATNLILQGGANITTEAGAVAECYSYAANQVIVANYEPAPMTTAQAQAGTETVPRKVSAAVQKAGVLAHASFQTLHVRDEKSSSTDAGTFTSGADRTRDLNTEAVNTVTGGGLVYLLPYDAQTGDFGVGETVTGGTSGATATIVADSDAGATGTLKVINVQNGPFLDNEAITDGASGAAVVNNASADDAGTGLDYAHQIYLPAGVYVPEIDCPALAVNSHQAKIHNITTAADVVVGSSENAAVTNPHSVKSRITKRFTLASSSLLEIRHRCDTTKSANGFGANCGYGDNELYTDAIFVRIS